MNNSREYQVISDPGHSWVKVPYKDLEDSGVEFEISEFSYRTRRDAFLEEDCDAGVFLDALKRKGIEVKLVMVEVPDFDAFLRTQGNVFRFPQ